MVPASRIHVLDSSPPRKDGEYVLYWMIASRRPGWNFALDRAIELAREADRPLVVLEALRCGYRWASDRLHRFVLDGMRDHERAFGASPVLYHPYLEPEPGAGSGLLAALARRATAVVTDEFPCFFLPRMVAAAARVVDTRFEAVDSNGLLPLAAEGGPFPSAYLFRRHLQRNLGPHLSQPPRARPLESAGIPAAGDLPREVARRWPRADLDADLAALPIDHSVAPVATRGGAAAAARAVDRLLSSVLPSYEEDRNHPDEDGTSHLSPWLHFGHVSPHEILARIARRERWKPERFGRRTDGGRSGTWGMDPAAEAFLDQLVTWRELGYNFCARRRDYDRYDSLPDWALRTLSEHARDRREHVYALEDFEAARTHDPIWNAAQTQLVREGRMHNYMRMLWGKKVLEWTRSPREALDVLIELNNKYALDGRNPNSYSGIFWILGRFDRAWGPERPIYGKVRYMTTANAARKLRLAGYVERFGGAPRLPW